MLPPELADEPGLDDGLISDEELTALALAADPDQVLGADAVPFVVQSEAPGSHLLSSWYMPAVAVHRVARWQKPVVVAIVVTLVALEALGLCSVFGQVVAG